MLVTPSDKRGFAAIESLIDQSIEWLDKPTEFQSKAGRGKGRSNDTGDTKRAPKSDGRNKRPARGASPKPSNDELASKKPDTERSKPVNKAETDFGSGKNGGKEENKNSPRKSSPKSGGDNRRDNRGNGSDNAKSFADEDHVPAFLLRDPR